MCSSISSLEPVRELAACGHVPPAGVRRDREAGRDGNPELRHLGEADALAAQQLAPALGGLVEVVDESGRGHGHARNFPQPDRNTPVMTEVRLTSADRVLFPEDGVTKGDLFEYYGQMAPCSSRT